MLTQRDTNTMHMCAHSHSHTPLQELFHSPGSLSQDLCLDEDLAAIERVASSQGSPGLMATTLGLQDRSLVGPAQGSSEQGHPPSRMCRAGSR